MPHNPPRLKTAPSSLPPQSALPRLRSSPPQIFSDGRRRISSFGRKDPKLDLFFYNIEETYGAYNIYTKLAGFSIRRSCETRVNNNVVRKRFVCSKEGSSKEKLGDDSIQQRRNSDCEAHLQIKKNKGKTMGGV